MNAITGFSPVNNSNATILILGSMPSVASLKATQYYAHPRNAFWSIIQAIYGIHQRLPYADRIFALQNTNLALWDVLHQCHRQGSLDSAIKNDALKANNFSQFLKDHPYINHVVFNGQAAEKVFMRIVKPKLNNNTLTYAIAPSTSPAYTISLADKIAAWRIALTT